MVYATASTPNPWLASLRAIDALLSAIENAAWSFRSAAKTAQRTWCSAEGEGQKLRSELSQRSEQVQRFTKTAVELGKIASAYRLYRLRSAFLSERRGQALLAKIHRRSARRFLRLSERHGGAFMKVGQLLSARADLLPEVWVSELQRLQDSAPPLPISVVQRVIEADFKAPLTALFSSFEETPLAAASIGQVHRAITHDGVAVAVKVQRPGIELAVASDLELLAAFVATLESELPDVDTATIVSEVQSAVRAELDYVREAEVTARVAEFFANDSRVRVARPLLELCSQHVLTTELVAGDKITRVLDALEAQTQAADPLARHTSSAILGRLLEAYLRQILEAGVFQADPHPGNLLVTDDDRVCVLDFGCTGELSDEKRAAYLELLRAGLFGEREAMSRVLLELGFKTRSGRPETLHDFADVFLGELRQMASGGGVKWPDADELTRRAGELLTSCRNDPVVVLPPEFVMIARVLATLSGLFARYQPDIDFGRHVMPVISRAFMTNLAASA